MSFERIPLLVIGISEFPINIYFIIESFILDNDCYLLLNKEFKP